MDKDDLRERVARAICKARYGHLRGYEGRETSYRREADAVIPIIRIAALEEAAGIVENHPQIFERTSEQAEGFAHSKVRIATAIRSRMGAAG